MEIIWACPLSHGLFILKLKPRLQICSCICISKSHFHEDLYGSTYLIRIFLHWYRVKHKLQSPSKISLFVYWTHINVWVTIGKQNKHQHYSLYEASVFRCCDQISHTDSPFMVTLIGPNAFWLNWNQRKNIRLAQMFLEALKPAPSVRIHWLWHFCIVCDMVS